MKTIENVANDNNLKNIIDQIIFSYDESENQDELFTTNHIKYDVSITYNERTFTTTYQTAQDVKKDDVIYCLINDAMAYELTKDIDIFAKEYYTDDVSIKKVIKTFKACEYTSNMLHKIFTDEEIKEVQKELEERGY